MCTFIYGKEMAWRRFTDGKEIVWKWSGGWEMVYWCRENALRGTGNGNRQLLLGHEPLQPPDDPFQRWLTEGFRSGLQTWPREG
jgi:hypothetical protein